LLRAHKESDWHERQDNPCGDQREPKGTSEHKPHRTPLGWTICAIEPVTGTSFRQPWQDAESPLSTQPSSKMEGMFSDQVVTGWPRSDTEKQCQSKRVTQI
jgi:hypothetical protein